ncbi:LADA_0A06018g1_1 [Lachancea dasiensis]|uniref:LADA_0A06018g1_1 n=1 Tax=Lachancea dasiensis TaxID=1072105 RepID=A0A1G4IP71_9SACH|nr:LADA_0A06018g1_1 [Lachancea dasiensis]
MSDMVITLAHFCDKHGPRALLGTQCAEDGDALLLPDYPTEAFCASCSMHFPGGDTCTRSMRTRLNSMDYVSTNYPAIRYQLLSTVIRHMFSEETMTYDCAPLTFFDQSKGLNLVMGFKLPDADARGDERRYAILLTIDSRDQVASMEILSKHWEFITNSFKRVIDHIKQKRETEVRRNAKNYSGQFTPMVGTYLKGNKSKVPQNLVQLTHDDLLFVRLHKWNTFMLHQLNSLE